MSENGQLNQPPSKSEQAEEETHTEQPSAAQDHDTLKYHLLGPSLTKAGQDAVDQQKVRRCPSVSDS